MGVGLYLLNLAVLGGIGILGGIVYVLAGVVLKIEEIDSIVQKFCPLGV